MAYQKGGLWVKSMPWAPERHVLIVLMDGILASRDNIEEIARSINISVNNNKSTRIFVVGHYDCRGNPVDEKTHREHIIMAVKRLRTYWPTVEIAGLWVNSYWQAEVWPK